MSTTYGAAGIIALISVIASLAVGMQHVQAHQRATTAADLAALSAAYVALSGEGTAGQICEVARDIAAANGAELTDCRHESGAETVTVATRVRSIASVTGALGDQKARAVAGPADDVDE